MFGIKLATLYTRCKSIFKAKSYFLSHYMLRVVSIHKLFLSTKKTKFSFIVASAMLSSLGLEESISIALLLLLLVRLVPMVLNDASGFKEKAQTLRIQRGIGKFQTKQSSTIFIENRESIGRLSDGVSLKLQSDCSIIGSWSERSLRCITKDLVQKSACYIVFSW